MIYDLSHFNAKLKFLPHFHSTLDIENDSADGASLYYGHILVFILVFCLFGVTDC